MLLGNLASKMLSFFLIPLYTSFLSKEEYGLIDVYFITASLIFPFISLCIYEATLRMLLDNNDNKGDILYNCLFVNICGIIAFTLCFIIFCFFRFNLSLLLFYMYCVADLFYMNMMYIARGMNRMDSFAIASLICAGTILTLNIIFLAFLKWSANGCIGAYVLSFILSGIFLIFHSGIYKHLTFSKSDTTKQTAKRMLAYSIPLIPNSISWWINSSLDKYILIFFCGIASNGLFAISGKIPSLLSIVSNSFVGAWQISSVENFGSEQSKYFFSDIYEKIIAISTICASFIILCIKPIASILFKNEFYDAWRCSSILIYASMFYSFGAFFGTVFTSAKKTCPIFITTLIGAVLNFFLNILLIPPYKEIGAALATLLCFVFVFFLRFVISKSYLSFKIHYWNNIAAYILIGVQILATIQSFHFWPGISLVCFLLVITLKFHVVFSFLHSLESLFSKYTKKVRL